jgi:hypothetical protein
MYRFLFVTTYDIQTYIVQKGEELALNDVQVFELLSIDGDTVTLRSELEGQHPSEPVYDWSIEFLQIDYERKRVKVQMTSSVEDGQRRSEKWLAQGESIRTSAGRIYFIQLVHKNSVSFTMREDFVLRKGHAFYTGNHTWLSVVEIDKGTSIVTFEYEEPSRLSFLESLAF